MLKNMILICFILLLVHCNSGPSLGRSTLVYSQPFDTQSSLKDFRFTSPEQWTWAMDSSGNGFLQITERNDYQPPVRSPHSIAVLDKFQVKDFTLTVDMIQQPVPHDCKGRHCIVCQHRDMCIFWGIQDSSHFYYAHIAAHCDEVSHQIHIVNGAPRTAITQTRSDGVSWGYDEWKQIRVVHKSDSGVTKVYFNAGQQPVLTARDTTFQTGYIGFGGFDETGRIDNIKLYSNGVSEKKTTLFESKLVIDKSNSEL